jgi:hypothetical protein
MDRSAPRRAGRPCRIVLLVEPRRERHLLPDRHDLFRNPGAAPRGRALGRVGQAHHLLALRPPPDPRCRQDRRHRRHGHDREAGRLGSTADADAGERQWRRHLVARRPQMVLLGAALRRVSHAGANRCRRVLLRRSRLARRRLAQSAAAAAPQGQMRQQVECVLGGRIPRRAGAPDRRARSRHPHRHRDESLHPARLRRRLRRPDAPGAGTERITRRTAARSSAR